MKILLCGDSFAADWSVDSEYQGLTGWVNLLAKEHTVTSLARHAVSEYKVLKQIESVDLMLFDAIIICHAPPSRIHCEKHPFYTGLESDGDLILEEMSKSNNTDATLAFDFINRYRDNQYQIDIANMFVDKIIGILMNNPTLITIHLENYGTESKYQGLDTYNVNPILVAYPGVMNHFSDEGNEIILSTVSKLLSSTAQSDPL